MSIPKPPRTQPMLLVVALACLAGRAHAQEGGPSDTVPPRILAPAEATYPAGVTPRRQEVELLVTIGVDGSVESIEIPSPVGEGFDEAAREALARHRFEPARVGGVPTRARIRFRYVFEPPVEEAPALPAVAEPIPTGRLAGEVLGAADVPAVDAEVVVTRNGAPVWQGTTDAQGRFVAEPLEPGRYSVTVTTRDGAVTSNEEEVVAGEETAIVYRVAVAGAEDEEEATLGVRAVIDPPPREVTRRVIPREMLTRVPGTAGDALRSIELMPGVARPPFGAGMLAIRGAAPTDSDILVDGVSVPLLYHFGGLTSFINGRLLERIEFYPGNFSSRYGRRTGGIVEVETRDPATDRFHGVIEARAIDGTLLLEGPITERFSIAASFRRSVIDLLFSSLLGDDAVRFTQAPVYYDYQLIATWCPTERDRIKLRFYGSSDALSARFTDDASDDPDVRGNAGIALRFNHLHASWDRQLAGRATQRLTLSAGPTRYDTRFGATTRLDARLWQISGRAEWTVPVGERVRVVAGTDVLALPYDVVYRGQPPIASEGDPGTGITHDETQFRGRGYILRPSAYVDVGAELGPLYVNLGQRVDYFSDIEAWTYDPRLAARLTLSDAVRLKAGVGLFSQPPEYVEALEGIGNPELDPIRSLHTSAGVDITLEEGIELGVEGFFKYLWNRVVPAEQGASPRFETGGIGRVYGAELSARIDPSESRRYFGYLSYTLMRSERQDEEGGRWRVFDYDQTHILTATAGYRFRRNWEIGGTFRLASGNPYTQLEGSVHDLDGSTYVPIPGPLNGQRSPTFHRLDVRVEKQWLFESWRLAFFVDVQNAYNRLNQEGLAYSFDYGQRTPLRGLPIVPSIGIRGEL